jgi:transposase-like protein
MAREGREVWAKRVERWVDSGLSAKEFAAETGVNANTLAHWRWRLGAKAPAGRTEAATAPVRFVELAAAPAAEEAGGFEVVLAGGRTVRVPPRFDATELARLVQVLEGARS